MTPVRVTSKPPTHNLLRTASGRNTLMELNTFPMQKSLLVRAAGLRSGGAVRSDTHLSVGGPVALAGCQRLLDLTQRAAFVCSASQADVRAFMDLCVEMDSTARRAKCQFSKPPE